MQVGTYTTKAVATPLRLATFEEPTSLTIAGKNGVAVTISMQDGSVKLSDGYTPDEAAKTFWEAVTRMYPGSVKP